MKLKTRSFLSLSLIGFIASFVLPFEASGQVRITIDGTYDIPLSVFGESGNSNPYSYSLTFSSQATSVHSFGVGETLAGKTTTHEWYGYSSLDVLDFDVSFGTKTFDLANVDTPDIEAGVVGADFWFDTDITQQAPTLFYFSITDFTGSPFGALYASEIQSEVVNIFINPSTRIVDFSSGGATNTDFGVTISAVPEASSLVILGMGSIALTLRRRRRNA